MHRFFKFLRIAKFKILQGLVETPEICAVGVFSVPLGVQMLRPKLS